MRWEPDYTLRNRKRILKNWASKLVLPRWALIWADTIQLQTRYREISWANIWNRRVKRDLAFLAKNSSVKDSVLLCQKNYNSAAMMMISMSKLRKISQILASQLCWKARKLSFNVTVWSKGSTRSGPAQSNEKRTLFLNRVEVLFSRTKLPFLHHKNSNLAEKLTIKIS